jgi:hypothetical protein
MGSLAVDASARPASAGIGRAPSVAARGASAANWIALAIVCVAAFAIYSRVWTHAPLTMMDTVSYLHPVDDFRAHHHFTQLHGRLPGLTVFLLLVGTGRFCFYATLALHLLAVGALALLLFRLAVRPAFVWAFVFLAILPPYVQNAAFLSSETFTEAFLALGFVLLSLCVLNRSWPLALLGSLCLVWAGLARPAVLFVPFALALILVLVSWQRFRRAAAILVLAPILFAGSWVLYTGIEFHYFGLSYFSGYQLSCSTIGMYEYIDNPIAREELLNARAEMYVAGMTPNDAIWKAVPHLEQRLGLNEVDLGRFLLRMNVKLITHHPEVFLEEFSRAMLMYWFPYLTKSLGYGGVLKLLWDAFQLMVAAVFLFEVAVLGGFAIGSRFVDRGLISGVSDRLLIYLLALGAIFQVEIMSCAVVGGSNPRFRSVTDPLSIFCAVFVADWALTAWRGSRRAPLLGQVQP